jgi:hypothetical protein
LMDLRKSRSRFWRKHRIFPRTMLKASIVQSTPQMGITCNDFTEPRRLVPEVVWI